jgi:outer membrane murein-binding lipoprotein Lpp
MIKTPVRFDEATALLLDADERQLADILAFAEMINAGPHIATCINDHETLTAQVAELRDLSDRLKLEAQTHAQEARTANATIAEIYQLCTGGTGEPGSWNGAEPVRKLVAQVAELKGEVERLKAHRFAADERLRQFEGFVHLRACRHRCFCDSFAETYPAGEPNE